MKRLSHEAFDRVARALGQYARNLELAQFNYFFNNGTPEKILQELSFFQNADGGFGRGLEPDFILPDSSPMASSIALQILSQLPLNPMVTQVVQKGITYLENTYIPTRPPLS